jgi:hypothetical protein
MTWQAWVGVSLGIAVLAALLLVLALWLRKKELRRRIESPRASAHRRALQLARDVEAKGQLVAFVANPSKPDVALLKAAIERSRRERNLQEPQIDHPPTLPTRDGSPRPHSTAGPRRVSADASGSRGRRFCP